MDQLEAWRVRGRIATATKNLREAVVRVLTDSQELTEAVAEAERLGLCDEMPAVVGIGAVR